jgi:hypothetical protein
MNFRPCQAIVLLAEAGNSSALTGTEAAGRCARRTHGV